MVLVFSGPGWSAIATSIVVVVVVVGVVVVVVVVVFVVVVVDVIAAGFDYDNDVRKNVVTEASGAGENSNSISYVEFKAEEKRKTINESALQVAAIKATT